MKRNLIRIATVVAALTMVLSLNAFAAVGDSVANVFLKKSVVDATAEYYGLKDHQTYTEWAETQGYPGINKPECAVDGRYDDWGDYSRWVAKPGPGVFVIDLDGYFTLETLDVYHIWTSAYGDSECDWFTAQVSADSGKTWTTIIKKVALDHNTAINILDGATQMGIYKSTLDMKGAVGNKVRFIFDDADAKENGFQLQEIQCSGKVAAKPSNTTGTDSPDTFDGISVAVAAMALAACGVVVSKKRR